jgi:hypothetical protein
MTRVTGICFFTADWMVGARRTWLRTEMSEKISWFGIPKFIAQESPPKNLRTVGDGRRCGNNWNVPIKTLMFPAQYG